SSASPSATSTLSARARRGLASAPVTGPVSVPGARGGVLRRHLGVRPDPGFLADPATMFPVVVDPPVSWQETADTYVKSASASSSYYTDTQLVIGYDGSSKYRSYVKAPDSLLSKISGKAVVGAYLQMFNSYSSTCGTGSNTAVNVFENSTAFGSGTTWSSKPARRTTSPMASTVFDPPHGRDECGGAAYANIDISPIAKDWAGGSYPVKVVEVSAGESDAYGFKRFYSGNASSGIPSFYITYGSYPGVPHDRSVDGGVTLSSTTFTVTATVDDPDGAWVQGQFFLQDQSENNAWVTPESGSFCTSVESGGTTACSWPNLKNGHTYQWRMRTVKLVDGATVVGEYSSMRTFTIDTTASDRATVKSPA
ncbi:MAG: hypothetical protein QG671_1286, partial [Actinomycetota bacterium]|nr:hypothetical protein [Actinomycetota bacterium]